LHAEEGSAEDIASTAAYATEDLPEPADDDAAVSARLQEAIASSLSALDSSRYYNPLRHVANIQPALEAALSRLARPKKRTGADAQPGEAMVGHRTPLASMTASSRVPGAPARSAKRSKRTTKQRDVGAASLQMVATAAERRHSLQVFKGREVPSAGAPVQSTSRLIAADYAEADDMIHSLDEMGFDEDDDDDFAVDSFAASRPASNTSRRDARWQSGPTAAGSVATAPPRWPAQDSRLSGAGSGFAAAGARQHAVAARRQCHSAAAAEAMGAAAAAAASPLSDDLDLDNEEPWARPQRSQSQKRHALGETLQQARQSRSILSKRLPKPVAPQ
jgi:hypothetical protein